MRDERLAAVTEAIEAYLTRHPEAADSVEGIARWWLSGDGLDASLEEVRAALGRLIDQGLVAWHQLPDSDAAEFRPVVAGRFAFGEEAR